MKKKHFFFFFLLAVITEFLSKILAECSVILNASIFPLVNVHQKVDYISESGPVLRILCPTALHKLEKRVWVRTMSGIRWPLALCSHRIDHLERRHLVERITPRDALPKHNSKTVHICTFSISLVSKNLGSLNQKKFECIEHIKIERELLQSNKGFHKQSSFSAGFP